MNYLDVCITSLNYFRNCSLNEQVNEFKIQKSCK